MRDRDSNTPLLSIIVPICNVEKYLLECLESIKDQRVKDIEVICINDGSTDSSLEILQKFAATDDRFIVIDKPNAGYGAAMNDGLDKACGKYLAILESDDFATENGWEILLGLCEEHDLDLAKGCYWRHSGADEFFKVYEQTDVHCPPWVAAIPANVVFDPRDAIRVFWMTPSIWSCVYKRSYLKNAGIRFNETPGASFQDTGFFFEVWATAKRAMIVDDTILHYRIDNSGSSSKSTKKVHAVREEIEFIKDYLVRNNCDEIFKQVLCSIRYKTYLWNAKRIADDYIPEFSEAADADLLADFKDGFFTTLLFNKKDAQDFLSRMASLMTDTEEISRLEYETSPVASIIVFPPEDPTGFGKCLAALASQNYSHIEVIAMLNEANGECIEVLAEISEGDDRFNKFVFSTLDEATYRDVLLLSHGRYVMFLSPADALRKLAMKRLVGGAYTNDADAVMYKKGSQAEIVGQSVEDMRAHVTLGDDATAEFLKYAGEPSYGVIFDRRVIEGADALEAISSMIAHGKGAHVAEGALSCVQRTKLARGKNPFTDKIKDAANDGANAPSDKNSKAGIFSRIANIFR